MSVAAGRGDSGSMILRRAVSEDAMAVAEMHVRSWQVGYRGLVPDEDLDTLRPETWADRYTFGSDAASDPMTIVALRDDAVVGFVTTAPTFDDDVDGSGQLCALYVDPAAWGNGVGSTLLRAGRKNLVDRGFTDAVLWVLVGNRRAERLYERDRWRPDGARRTEDIRGIEVDERRFRGRLV